MQKKNHNHPHTVPGNSSTASTKSGKTGQLAEELACAHLIQQGLILLQRNYRCRQGEIDLVMIDSRYIVFVEVRYRANPQYGSGAESITRQKRAKLIATASHYLQATHTTDRHPSRFDVISVSREASQDKIEWIKDAFQA